MLSLPVKPLVLCLPFILLLPSAAPADIQRLPLLLHLGQIDGTGSRSEELAIGLETYFPTPSFHDNLRLSIDFWGWGTEMPNTVFSACFLCSVNDHVDVSVASFGLGILGIHPLTEKWQLYARAGLSFARINYKLTGSIVGIPGTVEEDDDSEISMQYGFGIVYAGENSSIGLHARRFDLDSGSTAFAVDRTDLGGNYTGISMGWFF